VGKRANLLKSNLVGGATALALLFAAAPAAAAGPSAQITAVGAAPASEPIQLVLPLVADTAGIERFAGAVTTPGSRQYGQYETISELASRFGATPSTRQRVVSYLRRVGARSIKIDRTGLFADAVLTAGQAQRAFADPLIQFRSARGARFLAPRLTPSVPPGLRGLATGVIGLDTHEFASSHRLSTASSGVAQIASNPSSAHLRTGTPSPSACHAGRFAGEVPGIPATAGFTPDQYLTAYGFDPLHSAGVTGQGERVALIEIDGFKYPDLEAFAKCFQLDIPAVNAFGVGLGHPLPAGGEATLDLEVMDAAAPDLKGIDVYETKASVANSLIALTAPLQNRDFKPQVISASLGLCERVLKGAIGSGGVNNTEAALALAAASGITFLASSGDQGSADCTSLSGRPLRELAVNFPASSPWVTGIGGTNLVLNAANQIVSQVVWNDRIQAGSAAGGGLSRLFGRPSYQNGVVHVNHRGVPDVSMLADIIPGYAIFCSARGECNPNRPWTSVGGTSAATPLLAGGMALVDQQLRAHKRQDLGLADPLLYRLGRSSQAHSVFWDVLGFSNDVGPDIGGNQRPLGCCTAHRGYDLASGWGSVDVEQFATDAVELQPTRVTLVIPAHQHPVRNHRILAAVSCAAACRMGGLAEVKIGKSKPFTIFSKVYSLPSAGNRTVSIPFSSRQLTRLRRGLRNHRRIVAAVAGTVVDNQGRIESTTAPQGLTIKS
jgi:subtilase family serine protease